MALILIYIIQTDCVKESWIPWNKKALQNWKSNFEISLPIAILFYLEGGMYFINFYFAGLIHDDL